MFITAIILIGIVFYLIGFCVGKCNTPDYYQPLPTYTPSWEVKSLEERVKNLEWKENLYIQQIRECKLNHRTYPCYHCAYQNRLCIHSCNCLKPVLAKSVDEQKIVDLVTKSMKPLEELKKELGIN